MTSTTWTVNIARPIAAPRPVLTVTLETDDPRIVALVEGAANAAGVELVRELAPDQERGQ